MLSAEVSGLDLQGGRNQGLHGLPSLRCSMKIQVMMTRSRTGKATSSTSMRAGAPVMSFAICTRTTFTGLSSRLCFIVSCTTSMSRAASLFIVRGGRRTVHVKKPNRHLYALPSGATNVRQLRVDHECDA